MMNSGHEMGGGAEVHSRTLVSGQARSRSQPHSGSGPASFPANAHKQRVASASKGANTPSVLAGVIMLSALYGWWADLMIVRMTGRHREQAGWGE
jgi:hypothetical protein